LLKRVADPLPKTLRLLTEYEKSNGLSRLALPDDDRFVRAELCIEEALANAVPLHAHSTDP
jgi:hypothetical protein